MPRLFMIASLALLGTQRATAATPSEAELSQFIAKHFRKGGGLFGAIASVIPGQVTSSSPSGRSGAQGDGSYWTSAYFSGSNVVTFSYPRNALSKFCSSVGGQLTRSIAYHLARPNEAAGELPAVDGGGKLRVTSAMMAGWIGSAESFYSDRPNDGPDWADRPALVDKREALGVFSCASGNKPLWHVAILPTQAGDWASFGSGPTAEDSAVMLSVRLVDRALIERSTTTIARQDAATAASSVALRQDRAWRQAEVNQRVANELPKLVAYQKSAKVGDETNCGLVLTANPTLVEVQVPENVRLPNGASRLFVKRTMLAPPTRQFPCYEYGLFTEQWMLSRPPEERLRQ